MQEPEIEDAVFEEIEDNDATVGSEDDVAHRYKLEAKKEKPAMSQEAMVKIIRTAVKEGHIDAASAQLARRELGIFNSSFTKKQPNKVKQVAKRKAQKSARKKNRK